MAENPKDAIEEVFLKMFKDMSEEQMLDLAMKLVENELSTKSKESLIFILAEANKGVPADLKKMYHICFLSGYACGVTDGRER